MVKFIPGIWGPVITAIITLFLMAPFLRAIIMKKTKSKDFKKLREEKQINLGVQLSLLIFRVAIAAAIIFWTVYPLFPQEIILLAIITTAAVLVIIFSKRVIKVLSIKIEQHFLLNLHQKQAYEAVQTHVVNAIRAKDIHIENFKVSPDAPIIGKTLREINFKKSSGVYVIAILRGSGKINLPRADEQIYPYDELVVVGTDEEFSLLNKSIHDDEVPGIETATYHINLSQYEIEKGSSLIGVSIRDANIRDKTNTMIISIERRNNSINDFTSDFSFLEGDILLIAGEEVDLNAFSEKISQ
jgi:CPA2 family monovalent cation:H+ antiporter-2